MLKFPFQLISVLLLVILLSLNLYLWQVGVLGWFLFAGWAGILSFWLGKILQNLLKIEAPLHYFFGFLFLIYLIGLLGAVFAVFYKFILWQIPVVLGVITVGGYIVLKLSLRGPSTYLLANKCWGRGNPSSELDKLTDTRQVRLGLLRSLALPRNDKKGLAMIILFLVFYVFSFLFLWKARTGAYILSPWEAISPFYLYVFWALTFLVGLFIFLVKHPKLVLVIIVLHSLLLHAYLPLVYGETGFSGDKWRHLAAEYSLEDGKVYTPALFGEEDLPITKIGPLSVPSVFLVGNKQAYGSMWSLTIYLGKILRVNIFWIDFLLLFILWSVFIPLFLFHLGKLLFKDNKNALILALLPSLFFAFQFYGSFTLPNPFGFLFFLFFILAALRYLVEPSRKLGWFIFTLFVLLYFNYLLYFILAFEIGFFLIVWQKIREKSRKFKIAALLILFIVFSLLIPFLDTGHGYSYFSLDKSDGVSILGSAGSYLKKLALSIPFFPRKEFMEQDNFIFMRPDGFMADSYLLSSFPWIPVLTLLIFALIIFGLLKKEHESDAQKLKILFGSALGIMLVNQWIAAAYMEGNHLFSKRLVITTAFLIMILLAFGLKKFGEWLEPRIGAKAAAVIVALFIAFASITVYASGPKMQRVTSDELKAAEYIWSEISKSKIEKSALISDGGQIDQPIGTASPAAPLLAEQRVSVDRRKTLSRAQPFCILANTWPLLALETVSKREVIAGGFPQYPPEYSEPERIELFYNMARRPSIRYMKEALDITGAESCYYMVEERWTPKRDVEPIRQALGKEVTKIGEVYIFLYTQI